MTTPPIPPSKHQPIIHYRRSLIVNGVSVRAVVTNLTADFLDQIGDDPEFVGQ